MVSNGSAAMQVYRKGAYFANPCFAQIPPDLGIPVHGDKQSKLTLMSESLRNDGRIWVPKKLEDAKALQAGTKNRLIYLMQTVTSIWNVVIRHSVTWFLVTLLHVLRKNVATQVSV